jgi:S1-C subfamily serine protease
VAIAGLCALSNVATGDELSSALAAVRADEARRVAVCANAARSVVCIFSDGQRGSGGSGVVIDPAGYGLTNFHVVQPFLESRRGCGGLSDGRLYSLRVLGIDPGGDIVMFKLEGKERFDFAPLGDSDPLHVGQWVAAMGNPFVLAEDNSPTITLGVISGLHRYQRGQGNLLEYADCIQVSTSINPGNSGGPLFDLEGRVIGINGRASFQDEEGRGRVNVGLGYAVSINQIKRFLPGLRAGRLLEHGTLGATVRLAGDDLIVSAIQAFSPAEQAGVQLGDELLAVAGRRVRTANDYNNIMATLPAEWPVTLSLNRGGQPLEVNVRLERLPLRMPLYVLDLEHNHAELATILERSAQRTGMRLGQKCSQVTFGAQAMFRPPRESGDVLVLSLSVGLDDSGTEHRETAEPSDDPLINCISGEWQELARPLLVRPELDLRWELLAGDEVAGRIVDVVECRLEADRRVRWKFDWQTGDLLQVAVGDQEQPEAVVWSPTTPEQIGPLTWPRRWVRRSQTGDEMVIEIDSITPTRAGPEGALTDDAPSGEMK